MHVNAAQMRRETTGTLGRVGWLATGALYALLSLLAIRLAVEGSTGGHRPDAEGALQLVAEQPLAQGLLVLLMLGFAAHAVWRLADAVGDRDQADDGAKGLTKRAGYAALALWYAALAWLTGSVALGHEPSTNEKDAARGVLAWPLGRELVAAVGIGFLGAAVGSVVFVLRKRHVAKLRPGEAGPEARRVVDVAGTVGYSARALVFAVIGVFLIRAAWEHDASETIGLDGALLRLAQAPLGPLLLALVGAGFGCYAVWAALQARYRST
jgi:uncharacterized protein DUF1206